MDNLSEYLSKVKEEKGMTSAQVAKLSGLQQSTVSRVLSGEITAPSLEVAGQIAKAMDVSIDEYLGIPPRKVECDLERMLNVVNNDHNSQLEMMHAEHLKEIEILKEQAERQNRENEFLREQCRKKDVEKHRVFTFLIIMFSVMIAIIVGVIIFDYTHASIGYIRYDELKDVLSKSTVYSAVSNICSV